MLAGNKFDVEVETTPADASPGLFMKGLGNFEYTCYKPNESGFFAPFNVKDMRIVDTKDGWAVILGINNEKLRIFTPGKGVAGKGSLALSQQ